MKDKVILVVEDEALLRLNAVDILAGAGYTVLEAENADAAILLLEQRSDISIVFTDVNMPGTMDGLKLVQAIRKRWPPVPLIVTSGRHVVHDLDLPEGGQFLAKPYSTEQVLSVVAQIAA